MVHSPSAHNSWDWARLQTRVPELGLGVLHGWQEPNEFSHHLLPSRVCISRKLELETELGLEHRHSDVVCSVLSDT